MSSTHFSRPWISQSSMVGMSLLVFAIAFVTCSPAEVDRNQESSGGGSQENGGSSTQGSGGKTATAGGNVTSKGGSPATGGSSKTGGATSSGGTSSKGGSTAKDAGVGSGGSTSVKLDASTPTRKPYEPKTAPTSGPKNKILVMPGNNLEEWPEGFSVLTEHLTERGFKVVPALYADKNLYLDMDKTKVVDLSQYGLVIMGNEANANSGLALAAAVIPVIAGQRTSVSMDMATSPGVDSTWSAITVVKPGHAIAAGFLGTALLSDTREQRVNVSTGTPGKGATIIATGWKSTTSTTNPNPTIFAYEKGGQMVTKTAPERRLHFFIYAASDFPNLNRDGWDLYDAAIDWAMGL